jgi:hypothetical protein
MKNAIVTIIRVLVAILLILILFSIVSCTSEYELISTRDIWVNTKTGDTIIKVDDPLLGKSEYKKIYFGDYDCKCKVINNKSN